MQNLRCKIHPTQPITNFCTRQQCLTQLCATCICQHTDMHGLNGTLPHYENISQTFQRAHQAIDAHRVEIEGDKKRIIQFNVKWEKKKEGIYQKIQLAKKDVMELVDRTFAELEHKYTKCVHEEEIRLGMKNADKVMKMLEAHNSESEKLFAIQKDLAGGNQSGPDIAKMLFTVVLPRNRELTNKIGTDFADLEAYNINLAYHQNNLLELKERIVNLLELEVQYPESLERVPMVEVVQTRPVIVRADSPMYKTCSSSFYGRPQSACKPMKASVMYVDGNQVLVENRPKISVISGRISQNASESRLLLRNSRRAQIFQPERNLSQVIR